MKRIQGILAVGGLLIALSVPAFAVHGGGIIINNEVVLRVRHAAGGMTVQQRADEITTRVNKVLGCECFDPSLIKVVNRSGEYSVAYDKDMIVTVDRMTAADNKMSSAKLARIWAANLRKSIAYGKANNCGATCEM
ncbi:MAG: hypothetical protein ACYC27_17420 [Armatimonadota bacterium]